MKYRKTYEAPNTIISNVTVMVGGRPRKISFEPISEWEGARTGHGSRMTTDDETLQAAIERCSLFGSAIFCFKKEAIGDDGGRQSGTDESGTGSDGNVGVSDGNAGVAESNDEGRMIKHVRVDSPNDAKEYLAKEYGMTTRVLYDVKRIQNAAAKVGVVFDGL